MLLWSQLGAVGRRNSIASNVPMGSVIKTSWQRKILFIFRMLSPLRILESSPESYQITREPQR